MANNALYDRIARQHYAPVGRNVLTDSIGLKSAFLPPAAYPSMKRLHGVIDRHTAHLRGMTILDYGCGSGDMAMKYLANGAKKVAAIDASEGCVASLRRRALAAGVGENRCDFRVMDGHKLAFPDASFDLVVGHHILDRSDPFAALSEIQRLLKPEGRAILHESLADNSLMKFFRKIFSIPKTDSKASLTGNQLQALENQSGWRSESVYCGVLEMPLSVLTSKLPLSRPNSIFLRCADKLETWMHRHRWLLSWNQHVVLNLVKRP